jgi:uncharacterized protein (DUF849 family)
VLLQAALNGPRTPDEHPAVPAGVDALVRDAVACVRGGARDIHLHPRDATGRERLDPAVVDGTVEAVRAACGVPVGVSTGAWIEPDLERRIELVRAWRLPDHASVNVSERGSTRIMEALHQAGIGIEAGVWSVDDAEQLAATGWGERVLRVLVEPMALTEDTAIAVVDGIHAALDRLGVGAPRLQHGDGAATWILIGDAVARELDTRVGLEDTLHGPDGTRTEGNAALVAAARALGAG